MRIILVAEHASLRMGGEAALPIHYFRWLTERGIDTQMVTHARTRDELAALFPDHTARIHFLPDTALNRLCRQIGQHLPQRIGHFSVGYLSRHVTQRAARRKARALIAQTEGPVLVHQPIPVSPREPSLLYDMGAPVVIGPMNGNISWAPGFRAGGREAPDSLMMALWHPLRGLIHRLAPGKLRAALLLSANARTTTALTDTGTRARIVEIVENGIDTSLWRPAPMSGGTAEFLFMGRLVSFKGAQYLPDILAQMKNRTARIGIIGDGPMEEAIRARAKELGVSGRITFYGFLSQTDCSTHLARARALILPSLAEAGGAVVMEAMACARPAIAADHGGPADYIVPGTGWLVPIPSPEALIEGFAERMDQLADDPALAETTGKTARAHALRHYDWNSKIDTVLGLYQSCLLAEK
ncbi:glycosyltransferase family 4 protein [Falsigemmobacter faecalis]|uniref:Glycosyltransferase n=1 Tax=Falsigemmobacter faecalis TaxID=2488730 RepID=A0A3P3DDT1_9RHOB|nr:glycosyltransferase [Falsigemmobacter faecalis]RRH72475.1 glycosyltransferase [Falsigemmobacter faecalis]